jgi:hypothetical protein
LENVVGGSRLGAGAAAADDFQQHADGKRRLTFSSKPAASGSEC